MGYALTADEEGRLKELRLLGLLEWERCRRSRLYYLENFAFTADEHDEERPVKPLIDGDRVVDPATLQMVRTLDAEGHGHRDDYLRYVALVHEAEPLGALPKSRQMRASHLMVGCYGHVAQFRPFSRIAFQSRKEEDADALIERLVLQLDKQRELFPHIPWPRYTRKSAHLSFPNSSVIRAVAQGKHAFRSYTFSHVFSDETAFQGMAEDAYAAAMATVSGGGHYWMVSSALGGTFFQRVCEDKLAEAA